jgi:GTP-binding protein
MKFEFKNAKFIVTAVAPKHYPTLKAPSGALLPEIAVAGRSNVGKSSLLNHLLQQNGLVKTSSTPGKTQALNFFNVNEQLVFVDLPGYGFAKVPESVRKQWGPMIKVYLEKRQQLNLILFLFDVRRMPADDDKEFLEWIAASNKAVILVLTKTDKLTKNELNTNTKKILEAFNTENLHHIHYSVLKNVGRRELIWAISDALNDELTEELSEEE